MGDEQRGDGGVGIHLMRCLEQLDWPGDVSFCLAGDSVPDRANHFAHIMLLDAIEGPEAPGALYEADPEELLQCSAGGQDQPLGMLGKFSPALRRRVSVFAMHPRTRQWGSRLSGEVVMAMALVVTYLRSVVLRTLGELTSLQ